jgi:hypothetical protein
MPKSKKENDNKEDAPKKSVCEKNQTRKKGKKNQLFWKKEEQEHSPEKITMFTQI